MTATMSWNSDESWFCCREQAVDIQEKKVDEFIPRIRKVLVTKINNIEQQLLDLPAVHETDAERHAYFIDVIGKLIAKFQALATGNYVPDEEFQKFALASQAYSKFEEFKLNMQKSTTNFLTKEYHETLAKQVRLTRGASLSNFMSTSVFAKQVRKEYSIPLRDYSIELVNEIENLVSETFEELIESGMGDTGDVGIEASTGSLKDAVRVEISEFMSLQKAECLRHIQTLCNAESYIFTLDDSYGDFLSKLSEEWTKFGGICRETGGNEWRKSPFAEMLQTYFTSCNDARSICEMQASIDSYIKIRQRAMGDQVPLTVRLFLIHQLFQGNHGSMTLSMHLHEKIGSTESLANNLSEDHAVARLREELKASLVRCERARQQLRNL